ncbi:MAG TPA: FAD-binding oxidoreductase [Mycobacteriales bacterium]|nr:FAD-binding oxidoreductase [Mycobacteriales bacterium]
MGIQIGRREFLRAAGLGAAAGTLAGCRPRTSATAVPAGDRPSPTATAPHPDAPSSPAARPGGPAGPPRPSDWDALGRGLHGRLIRPGEDGYTSARQLYNTRFDGVRPAAVARCANPEDVAGCVAFARRFAVPLAVRSGGHSYAGWSTGTGLVLDVGPMGSVRPDGDRAVVGAGARLVDVYAGVARAGAGVPAGSCPTVGVTGLTLGGGVGVLTRAWGLTCDNLLAADVVTADGRLLGCDAGHHPDLYWALRGGGGGNFGVVTSLTLRTRPAGQMSMVFLSWPWRQAATVLRAWQSWLPGTPDALWSNVHLLTSASGAPRVTANAFYLGSADDAARQVDALVAAVGSEPSSRGTQTGSYLAAMMRLAGCADLSVPQCHLPSQDPHGRLARDTYAAKSHVFGGPLSESGIATLLAGVERLGHTGDAGAGGVQLDALGGAVGRLAPDATAFPHRRALAVAQYIVSWAATDRPAVAAGSLAWLRAYHDSMSGYATGAYVNYVDPDLRDWERAYYGANYPRLRRVKARYDPDRLFTFPQSVRPA